MNECDILILKGYRYVKFKNIDEFNTHKHIVRCFFWINEDCYYTIKDYKYSQLGYDDGEGNTIDASKIEEELKLNLDWALKIMESKYE